MFLTDDAYHHAIKVLERCSRKAGFFASGLPGGYQALWARDSMMTSLGAIFAEKKFEKTIENSFSTLAKNQSRLGQIPNCVGDYNEDRQSDVTFNTIDSTLWFIITLYAHAKAPRDTNVINKYRKNIANAFTWLQYQDPNEDMLIVQQPTMDWLDAFPHKYGRTINTLALYYGALKLSGQNAKAEHIKKVVNGKQETYLSLYDKKLGYYLPWIWKNHDGIREQETWFDALGNLLAIITGLATPEIARNIMKYIGRKNIHKPFPCKNIYPPIKEGDKEWHSYFEKCSSKNPYQYSNAGVWPFIGGWYVAALVKTGRQKEAKQELEKLARACKAGKTIAWEFNEWLDGETGKPKGAPYQGWSAGMYVFAYECVKRGRVPIF